VKPAKLHAVTGAFGYTGRYIARKLLTLGEPVITLTTNPHREDPFNGQVRAYPYNFEDPDALRASLAGVHTLYNTYWVRFNYGGITFEQAVENSRKLIKTAAEAGVTRFVHISVSNPGPDRNLPYFRGKWLVEQAVIESGISYAIIRPTLIFGLEDILLNNIAYLLRRSPIFPIPGAGLYQIQPIYAQDLAEIAVQAGGSMENLVLDAAGPEVLSYKEMIKLIAQKINSHSLLVHMPPNLALILVRLLNIALQDVLLTRDELRGLMANLLVTGSPPLATTSFTLWLEKNSDLLGKHYASELRRHFRT